ncbi:hypothetical protein [Caldimonas brevitalea]
MMLCGGLPAVLWRQAARTK